jgi:hypothetical protein
MGSAVASNDYEFVTHWRVPGRVADVYDILIEGTEYPRWWPQVYLNVVETNAGGEHGLGKTGELLTKGKLPYKLRWDMRVVETRYPHGFTLDATGDFVGRGVWNFEQDGDHVNVTFDWRIRADKSLLRWLSFVFKPIFRANHKWAMSRGEESLTAELQRRLTSKSHA